MLRWGLLSTARINHRLIPAIRAARRAELVAVASRDRARAEAYARQWGIPRAWGSYEALLTDPQVDVVYISLPNSLHAEWTIRAAQQGKHVLCEKPLALSVEQVERIMAAAESTGVVVAEAVMYLYHPLLQQARQLVKSGAIGQATLARAAFTFFLDRLQDVRWKPDLGGGCLWDVGSYPVSFIRWMVGEPESVFGWQTLGAAGIDMTFVGVLRYDNGILAHFDSGFRQQLHLQAQVTGTEGTLTLERPFLMTPESRLVLRRVGEEEQVIAGPAKDPYRCEVEALTAAVLDGAPLPVPLDLSRANVATLAALYRSARTGQPEEIPET